ncbi:phage portal protein [Sporosarcina contaminans]|uniref:Phage portal protein n=1 Tax=Sporosarcina contaminans TaxID=633403 RepID=A0ABW3U1T7_9BACL
MREYIPYIKENGMDGKLLAEIINRHKEKREQMLKLYERYKTTEEGVPILGRKMAVYDVFDSDSLKRLDDKVNNMLNNSFDAEIVDTKVGYLFGHPISYHVDDNSSLEDTVQDFVLRNNTEDADSEAGKKAAICGYGARLLYIDTEGQERMRNVDPWETIILAESDISEPSYAIRYYESAIIENGERKTVQEAEFYDEHYVWLFRRDSNGYGEAYDLIEHMFDYCPLFGIPNNEELQGDAEKVLKLIDAYDRTLSDASNEIEQYRLAYLVLRGMGLDEEGEEQLRKAGIFQLMDKEDDVSYLTKDVNGQLIEDHLDRLEQNILRFAKSVNFADEKFSGNASGVALKYKLMALENKCVTMERKFSAALRYQFKVLCSAWQKRGKCQAEDYLKIWMQFKRNLPANVIEEADASLKLKGIVSEATRLAMLSFVDDVDHELYHLQQDMAGYVDLDKVDEEGGEDDGAEVSA